MIAVDESALAARRVWIGKKTAAPRARRLLPFRLPSRFTLPTERTMAKLEPGVSAPEIRLPDQNGDERALSAHRGQWVLVYFYPRDDTPGCTVEACGLRDAWTQYGRAGIQVLGISADDAKSHRKFADKFALPFPLLADVEKKVIRAYGAWGKKKFMGREFDGILRQSFLVDPKGKIAKVYAKVKPEGHADEVLADVEALKGGAAPAAAPVAAPKAAKAPVKAIAKATKPSAPKSAKKSPPKPRGTPRATRSSKPKG
jgi:thioredoxin-dependent peroxiredoxin